MKQKIRVLILENSPEDYELEVRELRTAGLDPEPRRVETLEDYRRALEEFRPELILSDFTLPRDDGCQALAIAREVCPSVPFIYVSGTIGEDRAAECLKNGAMDYIVKGRMAAFGVRVRKALDEARERAERRRLEQQLFQAQKMEAIGRLAGGVAHDFNNILMVILGYAEMAGQKLHPEDPVQKDLAEVRAAAGRAADLTKRLLVFSRKQTTDLVPIELNAVVAGVESMLRRLIGEDIDLRTETDPRVGKIRASSGYLDQVIMNLAVNARDAMPNGGTLTIRTQVAPSEGPPAFVLSVSDTGVGMTEEVKAHIFEPFFTTKPAGKGTGLGLATVYGIVQQLGGKIEVESEPGKGTTFRLQFPSVEVPETAKPAPPPSAPRGGNESVLVVEDDDGVRALLRTMLTQLGYRVFEASHPNAALELCKETKDPIHVLLTDLVMPGMPGHDLAQKVQEVKPGIRVVLMSGYSENTISGFDLSRWVLMQKPFTPESLARNIRRALEKPL